MHSKCSIDKVTETNDLGILFDHKLNILCHSDVVISKAYLMVCVVIKASLNFQDAKTLILIHVF